MLVEPCIEDGFPRNVTVSVGENATFECLGSWDWEMDLFWVFSANQTVNVRDLADMDRLNRRNVKKRQVGSTDRPRRPRRSTALPRDPV